MKRIAQKQTFLGGAAVLALSTAIVKVIGACYKIPLQQIIGTAGYGYFTTAYDIYTVLLMVSTTGLPVAMSRMISEAKTLNRPKQVQRVYRACLYVFSALGAVGTLGMFALCRPLAALMGQPEAWFAIACLSPAVLFICLTSAQRGYFQGQSYMVPTSVSQIIEALCKLVLGLAVAYWLGKSTGDVIYAAGGAILGVSVGTVLSTAYLTLKKRRDGAKKVYEEGDPTVYSYKQTIRSLLAIAVPITLGAAGLQLISLIDAAVVMHRLKGAAGFTSAVADNLKGIYNFSQTIFNLPCAFITPLTVSIIPAITEHLTLKNRRSARTVAESAVRVMSLIALPCAIGLMVLASPIQQVLGHYSGADLSVASTLLAILGACVFFNSVVLVMNAIMQANGFVSLPVINMIAGGIVKVIVNYILVGNPSVNIVGAPIGTLLCYIVIAGLDLFTLRRVLRKPPKIVGNVLKPLIASVIMGGATFLAYKLLSAVTSSGLLICVGSIAVAGVVYLALVFFMRIITLDDCNLLPKGDKIAKILKIH